MNTSTATIDRRTETSSTTARAWTSTSESYWSKHSVDVEKSTKIPKGVKAVVRGLEALEGDPNRRRPGGRFYATHEEIAAATGTSARNVRRNCRKGDAMGLYDWDKSTHTFVILVRLKGSKSAAPSRPTKIMHPTGQNVLFPTGQNVLFPTVNPSLVSTRDLFRLGLEPELKNDERVFASAKQDENSSSSFVSSPPEPQIPQRTNRATPRIPLASAIPAIPALTPSVAKVNVWDVPPVVIDQLLLAALVKRAVALLNVSPEIARVELERKFHEFGGMAHAKGLTFGLFWLERALDAVEAHNRGSGNLPVRGFGFVGKTLLNFVASHGPPPAAKSTPPPKPTPPPKQADESEPLTPKETSKAFAEFLRKKSV